MLNMLIVREEEEGGRIIRVEPQGYTDLAYTSTCVCWTLSRRELLLILLTVFMSIQYLRNIPALC